MKKFTKTLLGLSCLTCLGAKLNAQNIYTQNFDAATIPALPSSWTTTTNFALGWKTDSSNVSNGYTGASGTNNVVIKNSDSSGTYILTLASINTTGCSGISVLWASRVSNNFLSSGSSAPVFEYSINGGTTWTPVSYTDNGANSLWALVNSGTRIQLPANADNQADLRVRWKVTIATNSQGTYRIDDFNVQAATGVGINKITHSKTIKIYPNPAKENFSVNIDGIEKQEQYSLSVFDITGKKVKEINCKAFPVTVERGDLESGLYFVRFNDGKNSPVFKVILE